jgi:hypothetical protein
METIMSDALQKLLDLEEIKVLKAKYFRTVDTKDWEGLRECFTEDLEADFRGAPGFLTKGRQQFMLAVVDALKDAKTVHHGHMPEIVLEGKDRARAIWAMDDTIEFPGMLLRGWGHYDEEYRRENGQWKISKIRLSRLRLLQSPEV